jgi:hypothetical protein
VKTDPVTTKHSAVKLLTMSTDPFEIKAPGVDVEQIVREVQATVAAKMQSGAYAGAQVARAERHNLMNLQRDEHFFDFYLDCLRESVFVDINDFEIHERRRALSWLLVRFKQMLWKGLKFYTYRLWAQQNQVNGLLLSATEEMDRKYRAKVEAFETRLAKLEAEQPGK